NHASAPAFCNPTLFSIPASLSYTRGAGLPPHASADTDFVTTAPSADKSMYRANSSPCPAHPDAVITGCVRETEPTPVRRSTDMGYQSKGLGGRAVGVGRGDGQRHGAPRPAPTDGSSRADHAREVTEADVA